MPRSTSPRRPVAPQTSDVKPLEQAPAKRKETYRETVEAIVGAVLLAILVRGFEVEAFVIPTGSMAPTLMGRHKEIACPQCGFVYAVNASDDVEGVGSGSPVSLRVASGICGNCRFQADLSQEPSFKGDRILVNKMVYDTPNLPGGTDLRRWDVVVFRFPEEPEVSYIKRLVGLPGESLQIWYGDVFVKSRDESSFEIARKPLEHQRAMQMMVYDDTLRPSALKDQAAWKRWVPTGVESWTEDATTAGVYRSNGAGSAWSELRYHHRVPDPGQWLSISTGEPISRAPRATLINDFASYNTNLSAAYSDLNGNVGFRQEDAWFRPHWVGDLSLSGRLNVKKAEGKVRYELIEGGLTNRLEIDLLSGKASLYHGATKLGEEPSVANTLGLHAVIFDNIDNRLTAWVDGVPIFGDGLTYEDDPENHPEPTAEDLNPARIAAIGSVVEVSDLVLKRDIYYTVKPGTTDYGNSLEAPSLPKRPVELFDLLADPSKVNALGALKKGEVYTIGEDRYMMLGDNSPSSRDSRGWGQSDKLDPSDPDRGWDSTDRLSWEVPRPLITGKAFCVFWPHGKPFGPDIRINANTRIPFRPYFERMKWIE